MLEEVRGAVIFVSLGSGTGVNPHADGRRLRPRRVLGSNLVNRGSVEASRDTR